LSTFIQTVPGVHSPASGPLQPSKVDPTLGDAETLANTPREYRACPVNTPEPVPALFSVT
jgi:hypothetical protein